MLEVLGASVLSTAVIFTSLSVYFVGMSGWLRGNRQIEADTQSRQAVRVCGDLLREAMAINVNGAGTEVQYRLPLRDAAGAFVNPVTWDGVNRRIFYDAGSRTLRHDNGTNVRVIASNVHATDVGGTNAAYRIFTAGVGAMPRQLTVQVVVRTHNDASLRAVGRRREVIFLRNVPQLTR